MSYGRWGVERQKSVKYYLNGPLQNDETQRRKFLTRNKRQEHTYICKQWHREFFKMLNKCFTPLSTMCFFALVLFLSIRKTFKRRFNVFILYHGGTAVRPVIFLILDKVDLEQWFSTFFSQRYTLMHYKYQFLDVLKLLK